jgi:hypothetical protein
MSAQGKTLLIVAVIIFVLGLVTGIALTKPTFDCEKYTIQEYANGSVPKHCEGTK